MSNYNLRSRSNKNTNQKTSSKDNKEEIASQENIEKDEIVKKRHSPVKKNLKEGIPFNFNSDGMKLYVKFLNDEDISSDSSEFVPDSEESELSEQICEYEERTNEFLKDLANNKYKGKDKEVEKIFDKGVPPKKRKGMINNKNQAQNRKKKLRLKETCDFCGDDFEDICNQCEGGDEPLNDAFIQYSDDEECTCGKEICECPDIEGLIDDSEVNTLENNLAKQIMTLMKEGDEEDYDPFEAQLKNPKHLKLLAKIKKSIEDAEPTPERIMKSRMPKKEKERLYKMYQLYLQLPENTFEYFLFRDMMVETLKEWESLKRDEAKSLKKYMRNKSKSENKPVLHQIVSLQASEKVKEGLLTMYDTTSMEDSTNSERMKIALRIPYTQIRLGTWEEKKTQILRKVKSSLDEELYGLSEVKTHLLMALNTKLSNPKAGFAILLNGNAGTGKTTIAHVLANSLNMFFYKISLGNLEHANVLTGGESIWKGSNISSITQALIEAKCKDPLILLDEIDKNRGKQGMVQQNVENALLQILDPSQNFNYRDLNIPEVPIDLSAVWWVATSNDRTKLSKPLLSRLSIIDVPNYTTPDLVKICQKHVLPKTCEKCGIAVEKVKMDERELTRVMMAHKSKVDEMGVRYLQDMFYKVLGEILLKREMEEGTEDRDEDIVLSFEVFERAPKDEGYVTMYL